MIRMKRKKSRSIELLFKCRQRCGINEKRSRRFQCGRSMLEMLAVLAIVGILSVAALAGLTWALAKYRANDTIHDVQIWYLAAADSEKLTRMTSGQLTFPELGSFSTHGYPMAVYVQDDTLFYIQTADVPKRVCSLMLDMLDETWVVAVNDVRFVETDICDRDANLMVFYFNKDMGAIGSVCLPACADDQQCCNSACVTVQTPCGSDGCTDCGADFCIQNTLCCPNETDMLCNGVTCCDKSKGFKCAGSECVCMDGRTFNPDTGACECPSGTFPFDDYEMCCAAGYTPLNGECTQIMCPYGTSGMCSLNNKGCGYDCKGGNGTACSMWLCTADECPSGTIFKEMPGRGGYSYGCHKAGTTCYTRPDGQYFCHNDRNEWCCSSSSHPYCEKGSCDEHVCDIFNNPSAEYVLKEQQLGGCQFENGVFCYPVNADASQWYCYNQQGVTCATSCTNPPDCDGACTQVICPDASGVYDETQNRCCKTTGGVEYCQDIDGNQAATYRDGFYCGFACTLGGSCYVGNCSDPGCAADGADYMFVSDLTYYQSGGQMACYRADKKIACFKSADTIACAVGSQLCGRGCDYGGNCQTAYSENCAVFDDETGQPHCVMSQPVTDTCICPTDRSAVPGDLCCPEYHQNVNGVCAVVYCEDGAVVDKAGDGYSDCSCSGTIENGVCRTM